MTYCNIDICEASLQCEYANAISIDISEEKLYHNIDTYVASHFYGFWHAGTTQLI